MNVELTKTLQYLQYPNPVSVASLQAPSFELTVSILCWLVQKIDPNIHIHAEIVTADDRAKLLRGLAEGLAERVNLVIDADHLLQNEGGLAVPELFKVASFLHEAMVLADEDESSSDDEEFQLEETLEAAEKAQSLIKEITEIGARLSSMMMSNGNEDSKVRENTLQFLNSLSDGSGGDSSQHVEEQLQTVVDSANSAVERIDKQCKILISNQRGMEEKIRKKTIDLERTKKRLESLSHVRPAYMDEYEQLEDELRVEYERYVVRLRNVDYLEQELSSFKQAAIETQKIVECKRKRMQKKYQEEEQRILVGDGDSM